MDQSRIGKFIQECRKEKGYTQQQLADKLSVSFKTVSKWECGWGLPDVSLMLPLCNELGISVNELLSGQRIEQEDYVARAEENLAIMTDTVRTNKQIMLMSVLGVVAACLGALTLFWVASFVDMAVWTRCLLIGVGAVVMGLGIVVGCFFDRRTGYFECAHCHHRFVPTMGAYVAGMHTLTRRKLKCPACGRTSMCKKRLSPRRKDERGNLQ